jgi:hypothetical protein
MKRSRPALHILGNSVACRLTTGPDAAGRNRRNRAPRLPFP